MPQFTQSGSEKRDHWLLDGSPNFAVIPAGTISPYSVDMPIRLQVGDLLYGETHIKLKHGIWVNKVQPCGCIPLLLHKKLGQSGKILLAEHKKKVQLLLQVHPSCLIILKAIEAEESFWSVTTMYGKNKAEGDNVGRYLGYQWVTKTIQTSSTVLPA